MFRYLDEELVAKILSRAVANSGFAFGLGRGLGRIYRYLSEEMKSSRDMAVPVRFIIYPVIIIILSKYKNKRWEEEC